jgi:hypothetical protein
MPELMGVMLCKMIGRRDRPKHAVLALLGAVCTEWQQPCRSGSSSRRRRHPLPIRNIQSQSRAAMRNPVACTSCRSAKQKCIHHNDAPPCDRCRQSGRAALCEFPPPGTSAIHRRPKRPRPSEETPGATPPGASAGATPLYRRHDAQQLPKSPLAVPLSPSAASSLLDGLDPFDLLTDEVKNSYLRCSYKWSFHHTPTLLLRIRDRTLEPYLVWALLALAVRYAADLPPVC